MLEGLDQVDWGSEHPRGGEIPALLRDLASGKRGARAIAIEQLRELCIHQSNAEPWSARVVPFLRELARSDVADRAAIVVLLADLAAGGSHEEILAGREPTSEDAEMDDAIALLDDGDATVRAAAALWLAMSARDEREALRRVASRDKSAPARVSMWLALGVLGRRNGDARDLPLFSAKAKGAPLQLASACGKCLVAPELPADAIASLKKVIVKPRKPVAGMPWCGGDVRDLALRVAIGSCVRHRAPEPLIELLAVDGRAETAAALVCAAFPPRDRLVLPSELDDAQRALLAKVSTFNTVSDELFFALNSRGFVQHQASLARFSGANPAGPLDEVIAGEPLWKHFRDKLDGARADLLPLFEDQSPEQLLAACADALGQYMSLHLPFPTPAPDEYATGLRRGGLALICAELMIARVPSDMLAARLSSLGQITLPKRYLAAALLHAFAETSNADDKSLRAYDDLIPRIVRHGLAPLLRPVLERMHPDHRAAIVLAMPPSCVKNGTGYVCDGCLDYLDLVPTEQAATVAIQALTSQSDPHIDRLVAILRAIGPAAHARVHAALDEPHPPRIRQALEAALR